MKIKPGIYQHYKGNKYKVHFVSKHSETLEEFVVYEALYNNPESKFWSRPIDLFTDEVEWGGKIVPRFVFIDKIQENKRPKIGIGVIITRNGKVLMGKRKNSHGDGM